MCCHFPFTSADGVLARIRITENSVYPAENDWLEAYTRDGTLSVYINSSLSNLLSNLAFTACAVVPARLNSTWNEFTLLIPHDYWLMQSRWAAFKPGICKRCCFFSVARETRSRGEKKKKKKVQNPSTFHFRNNRPTLYLIYVRSNTLQTAGLCEKNFLHTYSSCQVIYLILCNKSVILIIS